MAVTLNQGKFEDCCSISLRFTGIIAFLGIMTGCIMIGIYYGKPEVINPAVGISGIVIASICLVYEIFLFFLLCFTNC